MNHADEVSARMDSSDAIFINFHQFSWDRETLGRWDTGTVGPWDRGTLGLWDRRPWDPGTLGPMRTVGSWDLGDCGFKDSILCRSVALATNPLDK